MRQDMEIKGPGFVLDVGQEDIENGKPRDSSKCMIKEAIKRSRPEARYLAVDLQTIRFTEKGRRLVYLTPKRAQEYLVTFDRGGKLEPFSFRLRRPQSYLSGRRGPGGVKYEKARLSKPKAPGAVPEKIGGSPPPSVPPRGNKRSYGIRGLRA